MPDTKKSAAVNNAFWLAIFIAGICGGFLTGVLLQAYRIKEISLSSIFEVFWFGLITMIFAAPWLLILLSIILCPFAVALYFLLQRILSPTKSNFILVSMVIYCCFVGIIHWLGWYEVSINLHDMVSLAPTFIAAIVFGHLFHKFSQKASD